MMRETQNSRPDIAVIFDNIGPYHQARLKGAAAVCKVHGIQLSGASKDYAWVTEGSDSGWISTIVLEGPFTVVPVNEFKRRLQATLDRLKPAAIAIPGWSSLGAFVALEWAKRNSVPIVMMSESTAWDEPRVAWKEWVKRRIVGLASSALVGGNPHVDYMRQLGMPEDRIFLGYDTVDNAYFSIESQKWRGQETGDREEEASPCSTLNSQTSTHNHRPYFLSSNRFIEKKNLFRLLQAYAAYGRQPSDGHRPPLQCWDLVMLGDGELREKLLAHCEILGLNVAMCAPWEHSDSFNIQNSKSNIIYFPGFRQIDELPRFYAHAGSFVHASTTEQWGLVVNEAMACGLPVIVSSRVGCAQDLVEAGVNGFTFDPYDVEQLSQLLGRVSESNFPLSAFGAASTERIAAWGPVRFAEGLKAAVKEAVRIGVRRYTVWDFILLKLLQRR